MNGKLKMKRESIIDVKSYDFAIKIVRAYQRITQTHKEFVLSKQLLRSGTSIGANVKEAEHAQSKADFLNKMNIALKEANETAYWLNILKDTEYLSLEAFTSLKQSCDELISILVKIVETTKKSLGK
jgi:four helix bundle protein